MILAAVAVVLCALWPQSVASLGAPIIQILVPSPDTGAAEQTQTAASSEEQTEPTISPTGPTMAPVLFVSPTTVSYSAGEVIHGYVTSNAAGYPVTVNLKHLGKDQTVQIPGVTDGSGRYPAGYGFLSNRLPAPGIYEAWATMSSYSSNKVTITATGILVVSQTTSYSKALDPGCTFEVFSHIPGSCALIASSPDYAMSTELATFTVNAGGYGHTTVSLGHLGAGSWEIDALINGQKASSYLGSIWITVGP